MIITKKPECYTLKVIDRQAYAKLMRAHETNRQKMFQNQISKQYGLDENIIDMQSFKAFTEKYFGKNTIIKEKNTFERYKQSVYRTKRNMDDLLQLNINEQSYFVSLTYVGNFQDYGEAQKDFKAFIRKMTKQHGTFPYFATKEHQNRGAIHFHVVAFIHTDDWHVGNAWKHGYFNVKHIKDITTLGKISNYFTSYLLSLEKDNPLVASGKQLLFHSKDLKKSISISAKDEDTHQKVISHYHSNIATLEPTKVYRSKFFGWVMEYDITL